MKMEDKAAKEEKAEIKAAAMEIARVQAPVVKAVTPAKATLDTKITEKAKTIAAKKETALAEISKFEKEFVDVDEDAEEGAEKKDQPPTNEKVQTTDKDQVVEGSKSAQMKSSISKIEKNLSSAKSAL